MDDKPSRDEIEKRISTLQSWMGKTAIHVEPSMRGGPGMLCVVTKVEVTGTRVKWHLRTLPAERGFVNVSEGKMYDLSCDVATMDCQEFEPWGLRQGGYVSYVHYTDAELVGRMRQALVTLEDLKEVGRTMVRIREEWVREKGGGDISPSINEK